MPKKTPGDDRTASETHGISVITGPILRSPVLGLAADVLDDTERVMLANQNRLRQLTSFDEGGFGLTLNHPDVARLAALVGHLEETYIQATKNLEKIVRNHPLHEWSKDITGIGDKQFARLLATIGDPYWNDATDAPRTVSQLWAYCGYHVIFPGGQTQCDDQGRSVTGVAPARRRGQQGNWSDQARMRTYLIAASCIKWQQSPYRPVYDAAREKYAEAVHAVPCVRCGPSGSPAVVGSPLNPGHQHARGMRAVAKAILKDLWIEARRIHENNH